MVTYVEKETNYVNKEGNPPIIITDKSESSAWGVILGIMIAVAIGVGVYYFTNYIPSSAQADRNINIEVATPPTATSLPQVIERVIPPVSPSNTVIVLPATPVNSHDSSAPEVTVQDPSTPQ